MIEIYCFFGWILIFCILESCAQKANEEYIDGGPPCQAICGELNSPCYEAWLLPPKQCYCKENFARSGGEFGPCIPISQC